MKANYFSSANALQAVELLMEGLKARVHNTKPETLEKLSMGSMLAGLAFGSTGTAAVHAFGYPLTTLYNIPHGKANAAILPYVVAFNLRSCKHYAPLIARLNTNNFPLFLFEFIQQLQLPTDLQALGIQKNVLNDLAKLILLDDRHLSVNPAEMNFHAIRSILLAAWEGDSMI